ncbi:serine/threonine-protein phosphatase 7 [Tanacetum coccineum]
MQFMRFASGSALKKITLITKDVIYKVSVKELFSGCCLIFGRSWDMYKSSKGVIDGWNIHFRSVRNKYLRVTGYNLEGITTDRCDNIYDSCCSRFVVCSDTNYDFGKCMTGTSFDMRHPWKVDNRIRNILEGSIFHPLIDMVPYVQKTTFQSFIQDCYDKSSRTFTFGHDHKLKLYLGLQDVFAISGFPVDGSRPIICEDINTKQICIDMLGTYEQEPKMKMKVSKRWLKDTFEAVSEEISGDAIAPYVRGYLLYLIGTKVLLNCDKPNYYPVYWLQFLEDLSPSKLNDVAWGAAALAMLHTSLGSDGRKNVKGPIWIDEDVNLIPYVDYQGYLHKRIFFSRVILFNFDQIIYHEPDKGFLQLDIINLQPVGNLDVLLPKSCKGCQRRKLKDQYLPYIELWKNRHLEMNCIKDDRPCFLLPSVPAENDSDGPQSDQQNDLDGPQSDQQNDTEDFYDL